MNRIVHPDSLTRFSFARSTDCHSHYLGSLIVVVAAAVVGTVADTAAGTHLHAADAAAVGAVGAADTDADHTAVEQLDHIAPAKPP